MGGHKNKTNRDKNGHADPVLGRMAGEISPDIMFGGGWQKSSRMRLDGCRWMRMGEYECISKGTGQKQGKRGHKQSIRACFCMHGHSQKMQHAVQDGYCSQIGSRWGIKGKQGGRSTFKLLSNTGKQENKLGGQKKRKNKDTQVCHPKKKMQQKMMTQN